MRTKFSSINLLLELAKPENSGLLAEFTDVRYPKGGLLFWPGSATERDERDLVFVVKQGRIRLYLAVEDKEFSLAILEPGDIYATHTRAHVETLEEVTLMVMPTDRLHAYMISHPALSRTIISILGKLLSQSFSIIDSLVFKDIKQRLIDFFIYEATHHGIRRPDGILLTLELTTTQLAAIVGASRQTVSTILGTMLKEDVLRKNGRHVYLIANIDLLRNFAHT